MEVAIFSIAGKVAAILAEPIWRQISYPCKYKTNMEELKKQVEKLMNQREDVQDSVDEAKRQGEVLKKRVLDWLSSVDEFADKVAKPIIDDEEKGRKLCFNLKSRYSLSRKAVKATKDAISLLGDGTFGKVSSRPAIQRTNSVLTEGFQNFDSRVLVFKEIMEALTDEDVNSIGVWGMGGVGKTTLVKRVAAQAIEDGMFDRVIMAEVSQTVNLEEIQKQIADGLDMVFCKTSVSGRATQLRKRLMNETSILIILDNIWEELDLDVVGIPLWNGSKTSVRNEIQPAKKSVIHQKWRLLLTSRSVDVLCNDMNTQKNFCVETLSDSEALNLFWKTVDRAKEADFDTIAIQIVRKCAGLPIAITSIASALKNKDLLIWSDALRWLKKSDPKHIKGMVKSVCSTIELSYNFLESEEQSLFLLCALDDTGYGSMTSDLIKYSVGLNLFTNIDTIEDARNRMHTLISNLKASCLLLDGYDKGRVKVHDVVHAVALSIASSNDKLMFNIPNGSRVREMLEEGGLPRDSTMVSYWYGDNIELPEVLEFPNLKFFHFSPKELLSLPIPDTVFDNTKELKVLDLTFFDLSHLPSSLGGLTNLQTLCLDQCLIKDVAIIGELKKLVILSFLGSEVEQLPREIGQLTRLRVLDLSNCSKLKVISPNVLSNLTRLEELYMGNGFVDWDVDGQQNASLAELKKLPNLTTLEVQVIEAHSLPSDLFFWKLKNYKILIGDTWTWSDIFETSKILKLKLNDSFHLSDGIKSLLNEVEHLHLDEPKDVKNVLQALNGGGFQQLKHLHLQNAPQIQYICGNSVSWGLCNILPHNLESLVLHNLINLEKFFQGQLEAQSFGKLKVIKIVKCDKLKHLELPIAGHLSQLQEFEVTNCTNLEEIVFLGGRELQNDIQHGNKIEFTELRSIELQCLPRLSRFGFITSKDDPDGFMSIFHENVLLPSLEKLKLCSTNFQCKCLFSFSMVRSLRKLKELEISECEAVEAIFDIEDSIDEEISMEMIFPSIKLLNLNGLPKLTSFSRDPHLDKKVLLPSLMYLGLYSISPMVMWHNQLLEESFFLHNLRELGIGYLDDLKFLFTSSMINSLVHLEFLSIQNCKDMEVVINTEEEQSSAVKFPNLNVVHLDALPKLTRFSNFTGNPIDLSLMSSLRITNCPKMKIFISHSHGINMPSRMECAEMDTQENFQSNAQSFFDEKAKFSSLKELRLIQMDNVRKIWQSQLCLDSFSRLERLHVHRCHKISSIFPSGMLGRLQHLHVLQVIECDSVEEVFELEALGGNKTHEIAASQLEILLLKKLPNLKHVWNMNSRVILSFRNLHELTVEYCDSLKSLLPAIIAKGLENLEKLFVQKCMMEKIIAMEDEVEGISEFVFPQLKSLALLYVSGLKSFCSGLYISKWPMLKELTVWGCWEVEILVLELQSYVKHQHDSSHGRPLFLVDKVAFSSLNSMTLNWNCLVIEILLGRFPEYSCKLNSLTLGGPFTTYAICASCFLSGLPEVVSLTINTGYFKKIFLNEGFVCMRKCSELPAKLSSLQLCNLTDQLLWNVHPEFDKFSQNLTTLKLHYCNGLLNLVMSSAAKSLVQLTMLGIYSCEKIEEVISDAEDEIDDCIVLSQLNSLELDCLPNLTIFYSGSCKIAFPSLQEVVVKQCPVMKRFSQSELSMPRLKRVQIGEIENTGYLEGDLNTGIEQQYIISKGFSA